MMGGTVIQTRERLERFFLARLHRHAFLAAIEKAVEAGIVEASPRENGIVVWVPGSAASGLGAHRIRQLLGRVAGTTPAKQPPDRWVKKLSGWKRVDEDDGFSTFDDRRTARARQASPGQGQAPIAPGDPADPTDRSGVETDADTVGEDKVGEKTATIPTGVLLDAESSPGDNPIGPVDAATLLGLMRETARPPNAAEVAVLLMLADAAARSGADLARLLALLRFQPIVAVSGVAGLETVFIDLLRRGLILPGLTSTFDGYALSSTREFYSVSAEGAGRSLILFRGRDHELDADLLERQVSLAVRNVLPILAVADEAGKLPVALVDAADLALVCGPITPELVHATIRIVTGEDIARSQDGDDWAAFAALRDSHAMLMDGCELLTLSDLALAIRPGLTAHRCLYLLSRIAERRVAQENEKGEGSKSKASAKTSETVSCRTNAVKGTGSTIIQPEPSDSAKEGGSTLLRVETLSGYGEARDWALALKEDLKLWREGNLAWSDISTRLLLAGPPGTGKTTFARALCNTLQVPLVATSVATWLEPGYLGDVLRRMTAAFKEAEDNGPAILFIDEVDSLGRRTATSRSFEDYWNAVVSRVLELLDGIVSQSGIIVVGAANHPDALDAALVRSGRLEKRIDIPMPDTDALVGILRHHLKSDLAGVVGSASSPAHVHPSSTGDATELSSGAGGAAGVVEGQGASAAFTNEAGGGHDRSGQARLSASGHRHNRFPRRVWNGVRTVLAQAAGRVSQLASRVIGYLARRGNGHER